jgi:hypothetical protein
LLLRIRSQLVQEGRAQVANKHDIASMEVVFDLHG